MQSSHLNGFTANKTGIHAEQGAQGKILLEWEEPKKFANIETL